MNYDRFYDLARFLKKEAHTFKLRRVQMPKGTDGDCYFDGKEFIIRVEKTLSEYYAIEVLIHEVAHILAWDIEPNDHGPKWGKAYSIIYRKFLEWNEVQKT